MLPSELRTELRDLQETTRYQQVRTAFERGDVWVQGDELRYSLEAPRWVVISGHPWAIEIVKKRYVMSMQVHDLSPIILKYGVELCRHRHLISQYLSPAEETDIRWYGEPSGLVSDPVFPILQANQTLALTLLAVIDDDIEFLTTIPWEKADLSTIQSLASKSITHHSPRSLEFLLQLIPEVDNVILSCIHRVVENDDLELFSIFQTRYSNVPRTPMLNSFQGQVNLSQIAGCGPRTPPSRIFLHYFQKEKYRESVNQIAMQTRSLPLLQFLLQQYPYEIDWSVTLHPSLLMEIERS